MSIRTMSTTTLLGAGALGALGYLWYRNRRAAKRWKYDELPRLDGKVILVTGGNVGLGNETAYQLARRGAKVYITARSQSKGEAALAELRAKLPPGSFIELGLLDLSSFK
jgi:NADPH:quinone reductase-like Zn-dependent oxidoreductase